jgi:hypothetical protein
MENGEWRVENGEWRMSGILGNPKFETNSKVPNSNVRNDVGLPEMEQPLGSGKQKDMRGKKIRNSSVALPNLLVAAFWSGESRASARCMPLIGERSRSGAPEACS